MVSQLVDARGDEGGWNCLINPACDRQTRPSGQLFEYVFSEVEEIDVPVNDGALYAGRK